MYLLPATGECLLRLWVCLLIVWVERSMWRTSTAFVSFGQLLFKSNIGRHNSGHSVSLPVLVARCWSLWEFSMGIFWSVGELLHFLSSIKSTPLTYRLRTYNSEKPSLVMGGMVSLQPSCTSARTLCVSRSLRACCTSINIFSISTSTCCSVEQEPTFTSCMGKVM